MGAGKRRRAAPAGLIPWLLYSPICFVENGEPAMISLPPMVSGAWYETRRPETPDFDDSSAVARLESEPEPPPMSGFEEQQPIMGADERDSRQKSGATSVGKLGGPARC